MEVILVFLAQAALSGAVGHYVGEGLKRIHPELAALFDRKAEPEEIRRFVEEHNLEKEVESFATETASSAYIIPNVTGARPTLPSRALLIADVLKLFYGVSNALQMDLLLPGSFLHAETMTLIAGNEKGLPKIEPNGTVVGFSPRSPVENQLFIFPVDDGGSALFESYFEKARQFRASTTGKYFSAPRQISALKKAVEKCNVQGLSAGEIKFQLPSLMAPKLKASLGMVGGTAPVASGHQGIEEMLGGLGRILTIDLLDEAEALAIERLRGKLGRFADRPDESGG